MKIKVNRKIVKALNPCSRVWNRYKHINFSGDLVEFLQLDKISISDRIWVGVRLLPRFEVEVFAIDCAFSAAEYAAYAANAAARAEYAAANAAYAADDAAYAADDAAYSAAYAAAYTASDAARATNAAAYAASDAADAARAAERDRQLEALIYLTERIG
jgi:hypothetical protein